MPSLAPVPAVEREELVFHDTAFKKRDDLQSEFRKPGPDGFFQAGLIAEALPENPDGYRSMVHIADPYQGLTVNKTGEITEGDKNSPLTIVSFPSYATPEELQALRDKIIPTPEACEMLQALAEAKEMNSMLLIVGGTALGKTYTVKSFIKALYGPNTPPLDFYCNGQTDVSELHGMWVPKVNSESDAAKWRAFLETVDGQQRLQTITDTVAENRSLSTEDQVQSLTHRLKVLAQEIGLSSGTNWEFSWGAIPKAFTADFDPDTRQLTGFGGSGKGFPLHIQEVGMAAPRVVNALLELRGDNGSLTDSIQVWRNGGMLMNRGPDTFVVMTTNPDEEDGYNERNKLDKALLRNILVLEMGETLSPFSVSLSARRYLTYQAGNSPWTKPRGCMLELYHYPDDIGRQLAVVVAAFHQSFCEAMKTGESHGKSQLVVPSIDQIARLADYMLRFQVPDRKTGYPDLVETLRRGVDRVYLRGLSADKRTALRTSLDNLVTGESLMSEIGGNRRTPAECLKTAVDEIMKSRPPESSGFSPETVHAVRTARNRGLRSASDGIRNALFGDNRVSGTVRGLLGAVTGRVDSDEYASQTPAE